MPPNPQPLHDSVLRFERAKREMNSLDAEVIDRFFLGGNFKGFTSKPERKGETFTFRWIVEHVPEVDLWWAVRVGEVLYNLRASLDYMAIGHGGKGFPIHEGPEKWNEVSKLGKPYARSGAALTAEMAEPVRTAIQALQPYAVTPKAPKTDALWMLDQLRNWDTHRQLHIMAAVASEPDYQILEGEMTNVRVKSITGPLEQGTEVMRVTGKIVRPAPPNMTVRFRVTPTVAFEKGTPASEQLVGPLLNRIFSRVDEIAQKVRNASREKS